MAILGPSGAGKTMTLQCIAGLARPDEGYVELGGKVLFDSVGGINILPQKRRVGFVFQNYALFPHLTIGENIAYGVRHLAKAEIKEKVLYLADIMNIGALIERYPRQLSAGQQQRVAIARALAPDPEILLLDEPFSALDSQLKERLEMELLALQQKYQCSMLIVTHDLAEGYKLGAKVAIYHAGHIVQCDERGKVFSSPVNRTVARYTGVRNFMDGEITRIEDQSALVHIYAWNTLLQVYITADVAIRIGQKVVVGIRPEYIEVCQAGNAENVVPCCVLQAVEGITNTAFRFRVEEDIGEKHILNALLPKSSAILLAEERKCSLYLPPQQLIVMPE
ncbi:MAG: ATP-binding cassette domain-containing protein [Dehalococcoidia bacterium]|nr:ATP-binding cassette domain-containing protein [Dehalococcoidia bacterium]